MFMFATKQYYSKARPDFTFYSPPIQCALSISTCSATAAMLINIEASTC